MTTYEIGGLPGQKPEIAYGAEAAYAYVLHFQDKGAPVPTVKRDGVTISLAELNLWRDREAAERQNAR